MKEAASFPGVSLSMYICSPPKCEGPEEEAVKDAFLDEMRTGEQSLKGKVG